MARASAVFKRMLFGEFAEAARVSKESPGRIPLPDDDPEALKLLCEVIHFSRNVPQTVDIPELLDFAVIVDKYDAADVVRHSSIVWVSVHTTNIHDGAIHHMGFVFYEKACPMLGDLLVIAYCLDLWEEFYMTANYFLAHTPGRNSVNVERHPGYGILLEELVGKASNLLCLYKLTYLTRNHHWCGGSPSGRHPPAYSKGFANSGLSPASSPVFHSRLQVPAT